MRRTITIGAALAMLAGAAAAYAAGFNTYSASLSVSPSKPGSPGAPSAVSLSVNFKASGTGGNRSAPLSDIRTKVYGLVADGKSFPTCTESTIAADKSDARCPRGAMVATGAITAVVGPLNNTSTNAPGTFTCDPLLHVWNGGHGREVFFFVDRPPNHACGALATGDVGPYTGTVKRQGKFLVVDTPIPRYVSFPSGLEGSLESERLTEPRRTIKVGGMTVPELSSVACRNGKRPWTISFTAENGNGQTQTRTVSGSAKC